MYFSTASSLPSRATASFQQSSQVQPWRGSSGGKFSGFQTWQPSRLRISGPGKPLALAASALVSSGMPRMSKNSSLDRLGSGFRRPLAVLQRPECGGGQAGQPFAERQFPVNPIEALGIGLVIPHDPVEVIRVQAVEVGTEGVDLNPQPQSVGFGHGPPVLPFLLAKFGIEALELQPLGGKTAMDESQPSMHCQCS